MHAYMHTLNTGVIADFRHSRGGKLDPEVHTRARFLPELVMGPELQPCSSLTYFCILHPIPAGQLPNPLKEDSGIPIHVPGALQDSWGATQTK